MMPGALFEPLTEMTMVKGCELVTEAVPGLILQCVALLRLRGGTVTGILSLLISIASTALSATTVFWDIDTSPGGRKEHPRWWVPSYHTSFPRKPLTPSLVTA